MIKEFFPIGEYNQIGKNEINAPSLIRMAMKIAAAEGKTFAEHVEGI